MEDIIKNKYKEYYDENYNNEKNKKDEKSKENNKNKHRENFKIKISTYCVYNFLDLYIYYR